MNKEKVILITVGVIVCLMVLLPMGRLFFDSFTVGGEYGKPTQFTLENYQYVFATEDNEVIGPVLNTFLVGVGATLIAMLFGVSCAWITARTNTPYRSFLETFNLIPFFLSPFIGAISWRYLAAPKFGILNTFSMWAFGLSEPPFDIYGLGGVTWVLALFYTPVIYLFVVGTFRKMDPALEESARVCGSGLLQTTFRITLPLSAPAILSGALVVFVTSAGIFGVPILLSEPVGQGTLPCSIYNLTTFPANFNQSAAVGIILLAITVTGVLIQRRIILPREFITVTGKGYRPTLINLGRMRFLALGWNLLYLFVAVALPTFAIAIVSVTYAWQGSFSVEQLTLRKTYGHLLFAGAPKGEAFWPSLLLLFLIIAAIIVVVAAAAYFIKRDLVWWKRFVKGYAQTLPVVVPGVLLIVIIVTWGYPLVLRGVRNSLSISVVGATLAVTLVTITSYLIYRSRIRGRGFLSFVTAIPIAVPGIVLAMGILRVYINSPDPINYMYGTIWILMVAYMTRFLPFGMGAVSSVLLSLEPELDESSRVCGASWLTTMKNITAPLLKPGLVCGWLVLFIIYIRELGTSILLYGRETEVMSVALFLLYDTEPMELTAAFAVIQTAMILGLVYVFKKVVGMGELAF